MTPETVLILTLISCVFVANGYVSYRVVRSHFYERPQKIMQVVLIWLLPIIGGLAAWVFCKLDMPARRSEHLSSDDQTGSDAWTLEANPPPHEHMDSGD